MLNVWMVQAFHLGIFLGVYSSVESMVAHFKSRHPACTVNVIKDEKYEKEFQIKNEMCDEKHEIELYRAWQLPFHN